MTEQAPEPRTFTTIGVVGLGTMGAGIAEVFARNGFAVIGVELNDEAVARGRQHLEHSTARAVKREKLTEAEAADAAGPDHAQHHAQGPARGRLRGRGGRGVARDQEADLPGARGHRRARGDPGHQHLLAERHRDLDRQRPPGPGHRRPLLQPRAGAEPRRDHQDRGHRAAGAQGRDRPGRAARQEPRRLRRQGRLHRQHAAVRLPQPRRGDVRGQVRLARGHRRGDAVRLRLPDGPAPAARPDRPRHGVRDPRDDVPPGPRPAARARADPQAAGHRRHARPQDRPRLLHLRRPGQPGHRRRRPDPERGRPAAAPAPHREGGRRRHRHHGQRHRRGLRQGGVRRAVRRPQPGQGRRRRRRRSPRTSTSRSSGAGPPRTTRPPCSPRSPGSASLDDLATSTSWSRRSPRTSRSRPRCSTTSTTSASPARSWPPRPRRCRSSSWPGPPTGPRTSSACTSSTPRR